MIQNRMKRKLHEPTEKKRTNKLPRIPPDLLSTSSRFDRINSFSPDDHPRVSKINYTAAGKQVYYWSCIRELERPKRDPPVSINIKMSLKLYLGDTVSVWAHAFHFRAFMQWITIWDTTNTSQETFHKVYLHSRKNIIRQIEQYRGN